MLSRGLRIANAEHRYAFHLEGRERVPKEQHQGDDLRATEVNQELNEWQQTKQ